MAYFSHLPPQEAIARCEQLQGASEICSDIDNWKAYIAKRYALKYSVQRPDLLTAEEWQQQAMLLEVRNTEPSDQIYIAVAINGAPAIFRPFQGYEQYLNQNPGFLANIVRTIPVIFQGLSIVNSPRTRDVIFHVCEFSIISIEGNVRPLDRKLPPKATTMFESTELSHQWFLELLIPYYAEYIAQGFQPMTLISTVDRIDGGNITNIFPINNLESILARLADAFKLNDASFHLVLTLHRVGILEQNLPSQSLAIHLKYIPARLP